MNNSIDVPLLSSTIKKMDGAYSLTLEEELACLEHAKNFNFQGSGVDAIVLSNKRRIWLLVYEYNRNGRLANIAEDLFQAGNIGLIESIPGHNPDKFKTRLWSYAKFQVRKRMQEAIENDHSIIIHRGEARERRMVEKFIKKIVTESGVIPTISQISQGLNIPKETVVLCIDALNLMKGFRDPDNLTSTDILITPSSTEEQVLAGQIQTALSHAFDKLSPPEKRVLQDILLSDKVRGAGGYGDSHAQRLKQSGYSKMRELLVNGGITGIDSLHI